MFQEQVSDKRYRWSPTYFKWNLYIFSFLNMCLASLCLSFPFALLCFTYSKCWCKIKNNKFICFHGNAWFLIYLEYTPASGTDYCQLHTHFYNVNAFMWTAQYFIPPCPLWAMLLNINIRKKNVYVELILLHFLIIVWNGVWCWCWCGYKRPWCGHNNSIIVLTPFNHVVQVGEYFFIKY